MKFALCAALALAFLSGCSSTPYKIIDRKTEGPQELIVKIRADVPASATNEQMQSWCGAITKAEGHGENAAVSVEFLEEGPVVRQRGFCMGDHFVPTPKL